MKSGINIKSNIITWAITRAGYELNEFTAKFPNVLSWLDNSKKPTIKQLEAFSNKVHIPFGYLFLDNPPVEKLPIPFFRSNNPNLTTVSLNVYDTIISIQRKQEWLTEYLDDLGYDNLDFVGKFSYNTDYKTIVNDIREKLEIDDLDWTADFSKVEDVINFITDKIESIGIIMLYNGVVENNNYRTIEVDECRGFVLVNSMAPFMFINAADGKAAQLFTIIHELSHIWLGESAGFDYQKLLPANDPIEKLCDQVAAEFLVPKNLFIKYWNEKSDIAYLARKFKVSNIVIARRALDLGKITKAEFFDFYSTYIKNLKAIKDAQGPGGNFYATQRKRLSPTFMAYVDKAVRENKLLYRDAYKMTGLKGSTYQRFIKTHLT